MYQKLVLDLNLVLGKVEMSPVFSRKCFVNERFLKSDCEKASNITYFSNPVSYYRYYYEKQKKPGTSNQFLFRLSNKFKCFFL